jgi:outer membrane protein TolC
VDTAWADPEVMVDGMYPADSLGNSAKPMEWNVGLTQSIPLWGRQRSAGEVTRTETKIARARLDAAVRDVTYAVRRSALELRYLAAAKRVAQTQQTLVGNLTTAGAAAYAGERASLYEVMKARAQSGQVAYDALLLEESERTERARLNALLNRVPDAPVGPIAVENAPALAFEVAEIDALVENNLEDLRSARAEIERAEAMERLTRYETRPEVKLGLSYGNRDGVNQVGVQAGLTLPLRFDKNAGRIATAQADVERMRAMYEAQRNEARTTVRDVEFRLRNAERLVGLYRDDLVPQAERAVQMAQARLDQGQGSLGDDAEARSAWYGFRLALARAEADHGTLLARLESLAGRTLTDRNGARAVPQEDAK